jgi:two-component system nitrogen regulation response regulator NtrX
MKGGRILVVDDEQGVRSSLSGILRDEGFEVETAASGEECLAIVGEKAFQAILLDVWLPGKDGLETLKAMRRTGVDSAVIMISGHGTIETAVRATKLGAHDFVEKPLSLEKILLTLRNALRAKKLEERNLLLRAELRRDAELVGHSVPIRKLREQIAQAAPTDAGVLLLGENGSGKELVARLIHAMSPRAEEAFVEVACASVAPDRALRELVGIEEGAGAGAEKGKLELASDGTLFLDEVWALPAPSQQQLARALATGSFTRIGGMQSLTTRSRTVASSNRDLAAEARAGRFNEELFFKLSVVPLTVPPLRERPEDVPLLIEHFLEKYSREYARPRRMVEPRALEALVRYAWPGNVRELRNLVERLVILAPDRSISLEDLPPPFGAAEPRAEMRAQAGTLKERREAHEAELIRERLREAGGDLAKAALSLGIGRGSLQRKMRGHGIRPGGEKAP